MIRKLKRSDDILDLLSQLTEVGTPDKDKVFDEIKKNPNHLIYVLEDEWIIGCGTLLIEPKFIHNGQSVGHIEDIVIDKKYRNLGLGKKLIDFLINKAKELECYKVILDCSDEHVIFYEKTGFVKKGNQMSLYF